MRFLMKEEKHKKKYRGLDDNFEEEFSVNSEDEEAMFIKTPILYIRPKTEDIKEMFKTYLEIKKIF